MKEKQFKKWTETRKRGMIYFVVVYGVLAWGLGTGILWSLLTSMMSGWEGTSLRFTLGLIFFPIGGILFGVLMWFILEKQYKKRLTQLESDRLSQSEKNDKESGA
ncbi:MAG: hypothetical protein AAF623_15390 [Planctomycetota bacterium]